MVYSLPSIRWQQIANGQTTNYTLDLNAGLAQVLDDGAKGSAVHELAHAWDARHFTQLSTEMNNLTKSFIVICDPSPKAGNCYWVYNPTKEPPPSVYAINHKPLEDWADSFRTFMYPSYDPLPLGPIRRGHIEKVISELP